MATRWYFHSTAAPSISPSAPGAFEHTLGFYYRTCSTTKANSSYVTLGYGPQNATANTDVLVTYFVSTETLEAQTIPASAVKGMLRAYETDASLNAVPAVVIRVISGDGTVSRGTLLSKQGGGSEFPVGFSSPASVKFPGGWTGSGDTTTSVTAQAGDRIAFALGWRAGAAYTGAGPNAGFSVGDPTGSTDLGETEGETAANAPWMEFAYDFVFQAGSDNEPPTQPGSFATTAVGTTTIAVSWSASTDNVGVTGYRLYRNGSLVGTTTGTSFTYTGLLNTTSYDLAVEAIDAATNASTQATLTVTTSPPGLRDLAGNEAASIARNEATNLNVDDTGGGENPEENEPPVIAYENLVVADQDAFLYNVVIVTSDDAVTVDAEDATSVGRFGRRVLQLDGVAITDPDELQAYANAHLALYKDPLHRITGFRLNGVDPASRRALLAIRLGDPVEIHMNPPYSEGYGIADGGVHVQQSFVERRQITHGNDGVLVGEFAVSTR